MLKTMNKMVGATLVVALVMCFAVIKPYQSFANEAVAKGEIADEVAEEVDISVFPYSEETGELQFSGISWANLGFAVGRVHVAWENPDGTTDDAPASNWTMLDGSRYVDLKNLQGTKGDMLQENAKFHFYSEIKFGFDSAWSKWYSYNSDSDFAVGYYTNKSALMGNYNPVPAVYGNGEYANEALQKMASKHLRGVVAHTIIVGIMTLAGCAASSIITSVIKYATISGSLVKVIVLSAVSGPVLGVLLLASDVLLTALNSEIDIEIIDLDKQDKSRNWVLFKDIFPDYPEDNSSEQMQDSEPSQNEGHDNENPKSQVDNQDEDPDSDEKEIDSGGFFAISGFHFVSSGYYWAKPVLHWWRPKENIYKGYEAYVNESVVDKKGHTTKKSGLRMGKAAGIDLANLSRTTIVDRNDPSVHLQPGDIISLEIEVSGGKNRSAFESFVYEPTSDYQAGYFTQGTTFREKDNSHDSMMRANIVAFGPIDEVAKQMSNYVRVASNAYKALVSKVTLSLAIIIAASALNALIANTRIEEIRHLQKAQVGNPQDYFPLAKGSDNGTGMMVPDESRE